MTDDRKEELRQKREKSFIERMIEKYQDAYDFSKVKYKRRDIKVIVSCKKHGDFLITPSDMLKGKICPKCNKEILKRNNEKYELNERTNEEWAKICAERYNNKYDYTNTDFVGTKQNDFLRIVCHEKDENGNEHGEFLVRKRYHIYGNIGCKKCSSKQKTLESFKKEIEEKFSGLYDLSIAEYNCANNYINVICKKCGNLFKITPHNLLSGRGCSHCRYSKSSDKLRLPFEEFSIRVKNVFRDKYDISDVKYVNEYTSVKLKCNIHGYFYQLPRLLYKGNGCPYCGQSSLENEIQVFLNENGIESIYEYKTDWLGKQSLDFYLPKYKVAIECQGIQHFKPIDFFGTKSGKNALELFEYTVNNDKKKKELCDEHGIKLLYFSNLHIDYPYDVIEDKNILLNEILK